jgi:hypothetical protein
MMSVLSSFKDKGAQVVAFDFDDAKTLARPCGIESIVMITPFAETLLIT